MTVLRMTLAEAAASIPDGALLAFGGFDLQRPPLALAAALARRGARRLRLVAIPSPLPLDLLVAAAAVEEAEFGFLGFQYEHGFVTVPNVRRAIETGTLRWRERDVFEIVQGLRAAASGVPYLPSPGGEGTDYERLRPARRARLEPDGPSLPVAEAIKPDVVLLHVQQADRAGNLFSDDPYFDDLLSRAGDRVIATAERIVDVVPHATVPAARVSAVVEAPGGARPGGCHRHYRHDAGRLAAWVQASNDGKTDEAMRLLSPDEAPAGTVRAPEAIHAVPTTDVAPVDRLIVGLARRIADGDLVVTGLASALPLLAVAVARATHARQMTYVNCVGAVDPPIERALPTSVDPALLERCAARLIVPDFFDLARRGRIDLMFFGAAQIDAEARLNLSCIGDPARPRVKLPGPAGSSTIRPFVRKVVVLSPRHARRTFVERVDFASSVPSERNRETWVVTDLALLRLEAGRLRLQARQGDASFEAIQERTGFALQPGAGAAPEPTADEMRVIRRLDPEGLRHSLAG
ncbi:MAG TPA: CoA-transferase [Candidatus Polarisedimenticolia bacterium]|jgi:acyl CoA:acetate/3-ketoacid CoA transferase alpha subunit/acyl CoA:acetate/3-ketoacid CoA transferase beta subunit|nr:CoA-transferase [Candidatus Polarisedimenticolia bacterium]